MATLGDILAGRAVGTRQTALDPANALPATRRRYRTLGLAWFSKAQNDGTYHRDWQIENDPRADAAFRLGLSELNLAQR